MARVTRSKKNEILVAEDRTAVTIPESFNDNAVAQSNTLNEVDSVNTMPDPITAELKGLKAAYKTAIGAAKKGKRGKKAKQNKLDSVVEGQGGQDYMNGFPASSMPQFDSYGVDSNGTLSAQAQQPVARTTRQQAAQTQAGQYIQYHPNGDRERYAAARYTGGIDYITTPFSGRSLGRRYGEAIADQHKIAEDTLIQAYTRRTGNSGTDTSSFASEFESSRAALWPSNRAADLSPVRARINTPSRSPVRTLDDVEREYKAEESNPPQSAGDDSFVEQITARSPAKHVSRIEDSVEALDQLEEDIDAIGQATLAEKMVPSEKIQQKAPTHPRTTPFDSKVTMNGAKAERLAGAQNVKQSTKPAFATMRVKPTAPKMSVVKKSASMVFKSATASEPQETQKRPKTNLNKRPMSMIVKSKDSETTENMTKKAVKRPISLLQPKETTKSSKPVTKSTFELPGEAVAKRLKEQREARLAKRESSEDSFHTARVVSGPKIKSTKPPTTSTYELPGEVLSRRKREAHEARLKAQEEEDRQHREFKAKPIHRSAAPNVVPRDTIASRARQSKIGIENTLDSSSNACTIKRGSIIGPNPPSNNGSNIGAHRPSLSQLASANISAPRAPGPGPRLTRKPSTTTASGISMSGKAMQRTVSATDAQVQRQRAKEIYNRDAKLTEEIERERREREAGAKRAREEAAERGRQASREWAERQMAKKLAESDKGMALGYGPGGQLGLQC